ncbi:hypothetical protein AB4037_33750 [Labrys sp. KB_33_2]|uniref:DUF6911 family protein n=1 Tax=Labrys sp. KB_33_2 TaxID=3237479 RepID=UPI003F92C4AE
MRISEDYRIILTWTLDDEHYGRRSIWNPTWENVTEKLNMLRDQKTGDVTIEANPKNHENMDKIITVEGQEGYFRIIFIDVINGKSVERQTFDRTLPARMKELPDEDWDERRLFRDFDFAYQVFKEFFETQSVSSPRIV